MSTPFSKSPAELLATPVQYLRGVGPERAQLLERLGLRTARDLLFFFPRSYEDMSELRAIDQLVDDVPVSVVGTVAEVELRNTGPGKTILGVLVRQGAAHLRAVFFNQAFMRAKFATGQRVLLSGTPRQHGLCWEMTHPKCEWLGAQEQAPAGKILPVYALTEGLTQSHVRRIVHQLLETHAPLLDEVFPAEFLDAHRLWPIHAAVPQVHQPASRASLSTVCCADTESTQRCTVAEARGGDACVVTAPTSASPEIVVSAEQGDSRVSPGQSRRARAERRRPSASHERRAESDKLVTDGSKFGRRESIATPDQEGREPVRLRGVWSRTDAMQRVPSPVQCRDTQRRTGCEATRAMSVYPPLNRRDCQRESMSPRR